MPPTPEAATPVILAIDDDPSNLTVLGTLLGEQCDIRVVTSGAEALKAAPTIRPDLILLDVVMPEMDGFETCRRLKATPGLEMTPVIFITVLDSPNDEVQCFEAGGDDFVTKPFNPTVLRARIRTHLKLGQYIRTMASLAMRDGLTQIHNRRHFDERLAQEWRACQRAAVPLCVLMIDLDHFKHYNDRYGHQAGDDCLIAVANALSQQLRRGRDLVARYGGEEFVCLLPDTTLADGLQLADKLCAAVRNLGIEHAASAVAPVVTASIGVACATPTEGLAPADLLKQADQCLYRAKAAGRNQASACA